MTVFLRTGLLFAYRALVIYTNEKGKIPVFKTIDTGRNLPEHPKTDQPVAVKAVSIRQNVP